MKTTKLFTALVFLLCTNLLNATKLVVTNTGDHATAATTGMLRYHVSNAKAGDTIVFNVPKVTLVAELRLVFKSITIDGSSQGKVIIDGDYKTNIFNVSMYSSSDTVRFKNLIITKGKFTKDYAFGAGVYAFVSSGYFEMQNCDLINNEAICTQDGQGGGLRCQGGVYKNCSFLNNKVTRLSGVSAGGGVGAVEGEFYNCQFSGNSAVYGGALQASYDTEIYNCTFSNNYTSNTSSAAVSLEETIFVNCISYGNTGGGDIINYGTSYIRNSAFPSTSSYVGSKDNIGLSTSPFKGGTESDSLSLAEASTCIDAGTNENVPENLSDILNNKRIHGSAVDLGAFEYNSTPILSVKNTTSNNATINFFPNPSHDLITFTDKTETATIFDGFGKMVINSSEQSIDISNLTKGSYYIKIQKENGEISSESLIKL